MSIHLIEDSERYDNSRPLKQNHRYLYFETFCNPYRCGRGGETVAGAWAGWWVMALVGWWEILWSIDKNGRAIDGWKDYCVGHGVLFGAHLHNFANCNRDRSDGGWGCLLVVL